MAEKSVVIWSLIIVLVVFMGSVLSPLAGAMENSNSDGLAEYENIPPPKTAEDPLVTDREDIREIYGEFSDSMVDLGSGNGIMYSVAVGDVDNDGDLDVIAGNYDSHIYFFRNDGRTWTQVDIGTGKNELYEVALGDIDNDGDLDVVAGSSNGRIYLFSNSLGTWTRTDIDSAGLDMYGVALEDVDNDGDLDLLGANGDRYLYFFRNDNGKWNKMEIGHGEGYMLSVAVGDIDSDGDLDVLGGNADGYLYAFENEHGTWRKVTLGRAGATVDAITLQDTDADGVLEIIGSNRNGQAYEFRRNADRAWTALDRGYDRRYLGSMTVADIDADGDPELIGSAFDNHVYLFKDAGDGCVNLTLAAAPEGEDNDNDGIPDYLEGWPREGAIYACSPYLQDSDSDLLVDGLEVEVGMNPCSVDTDGDFMSDWYELTTGWDPYSAEPFDCCPYVPDLPQVSLDVEAKRLDMDVTVTRGSSKANTTVEYTGETMGGSTTNSYTDEESYNIYGEVSSTLEAKVSLLPEVTASATVTVGGGAAWTSSNTYSETAEWSTETSHENSETFEEWQDQAVDYSEAKLKGTLNIRNEWGRVIEVGRVWIVVFIDEEAYETGDIPLDVTIGENEEFSIAVTVPINQHAIEAIEAGKQAVFFLEKAEIQVVDPESGDSRALETITSNAWDTCGFIEVDFNDGTMVRKLIYVGPDKWGLKATDALDRLDVDFKAPEGNIISIGGIRNQPGFGKWVGSVYQNLENPNPIPEDLSALLMHKKYYVSVLYLQDTDNDWLVDQIEDYVGTDPDDPDSDDDLLDDFTEVYTLRSDPNLMDTDGGGALDGIEYVAGTDLNDPGDDPFYVPTWLSQNKMGAEDAADLIIDCSTDVDRDGEITGEGQLKWVSNDGRAWTGVKNGSAGIIIFLSMLARVTGNETYLAVAKEAGNWLTNVEDDYVLNELEPIFPELDKITGFGELEWLNYEGGTPDLSYGDGTAGIIAALIELYYASGDEKYLLAAVEGSTRLLDNEKADVLDYGDPGYDGYGKLAWDTDGDDTGDYGYMDGTAGIADTLAKMWRVTYQTDWKNVYYVLAAIEAGNWLLNQSTTDTTYSSGRAGLIPVLLRLYAISGEEDFLDEAEFLADETHQSFDYATSDTDIWRGEAGTLNSMIELYKYTASVDSYNWASAAGDHLGNLSWDRVLDVDGDGNITGYGKVTWNNTEEPPKIETSYYGGAGGISSELMKLYFITGNVTYLNLALEGSNWLRDAKELVTQYMFWYYTKTTYDVTCMALGDITGNGLDDSIVGTDNAVVAISDSGEELWTYPTIGPVSTIVTGDFDGDTRSEVVYSWWSHDNLWIRMLDDDGTLCWELFFMPASNPFGEAANNLTGTGEEGLYVATYSAIDPSWSRVDAIAGNGSLLWTFPIGQIIRDLAVGDFNNDSRDDVVVLSQPGNRFVIDVIDSSGFKMWTWSTIPEGGYFNAKVTVGDFDANHNGIDDVVLVTSHDGLHPVEVYARNGSTDNELWNSSCDTLSSGIATLTVCDANGDSYDDLIIAGTSDDYARVFAVTTPGDQIWTFSKWPSLCRDMAVGDINGDGYDDVALYILSDIYAPVHVPEIVVLNGPDGAALGEYPLPPDEDIKKMATGNIGDAAGMSVIAATDRYLLVMQDVFTWPEYTGSPMLSYDLYSGVGGVGHGLLLTATNAPSIRPLGFVGSASAPPNTTQNVSISFFNGALFPAQDLEVTLSGDANWKANGGSIEQALRVINNMNPLQQREITWTVTTPLQAGFYQLNISIVSTQQGESVARENLFPLNFTVEGLVLTDLIIEGDKTYMNVGENATVHARIVYVSDSSPVEKGTICINGSDRKVYLMTNETGWANITMGEAEPIMRFCDVYGTRSRELGSLPSNHQNTTITWTGLNVSALTISAEEVEVGELVDLTTHVVYGHNNSPAGGANVTCDGQYKLTDAEGDVTFTVTRHAVGTVEYTVTALHDAPGEITACVHNQTAQITYVDLKKPLVRIVSPSNYAPAYGIVPIFIIATDAETGIDHVELHIDNEFQSNLSKSAESGCYEYQWVTAEFEKGWHLVSVKGYDGGGNFMSANLELNFVDSSFDTVKPAITSILHEPLNPFENDPVIVRATVTDNNAVSLVKVQYKVNDGSEQTATMLDLDGDTTYLATIGPFNKYDYVVYSIFSKDTCSNMNISEDYNFTILPKLTIENTVSIPDLTVLQAQNTPTSITLKNSTGVAGIGIKLSYNASVVNVTSAAQGDFTDYFEFDSTNAANGWVTINTYIMGQDLTGDVTVADVTLEAVGNLGDTSPLNLEILSLADQYGNDVTGTTDNGTFTIPFDIGPPIVTNPASSHEIPDDTDNDPRWGETATLNVTITDDTEVASVTVNLSAIGGSPTQPMTNTVGNTWSVMTNASVGTYLCNGTEYIPHYLRVNATDIYGKSNTSVSISLVVTKNGDVTGNCMVNIADAMLLANNVSYPERPYPISSIYQAEVTGNGELNIADAMLIANNVSYPYHDPPYILR